MINQQLIKSAYLENTAKQNMSSCMSTQEMSELCKVKHYQNF